MLMSKIVSGGQTGVDRGAIEAALELGFPYGGLIPKGRLAEDGIVPLKFDQMEESSNKNYIFRTEWNVVHSDATLNYILKSDKMVFDQTDLDTDSPYNTYKYYGLPAGPISNPGVAAIEAALFPNEQYMREGYLYFCLMDSTTGALAFAKTEAEHAANVEKYRPNW